MLKIGEKMRRLMGFGSSVFITNMVLAGSSSSSSSGGISGIVTNVQSSLEAIMSLVSMVGYVAGFLFILASVMKFKQHKDNPTQVPVGTPVSMLVMGAALMFAGNFIAPLGESIFGSGVKAGASVTTLGSGLTSTSSTSSGSPISRALHTEG